MRFWAMNRYGMSEAEQRDLFVKGIGVTGEKMYCEVPVFCRSVDLVIYDKKTDAITAVEFKLTDWKRATNQALNVAICFDYIEICVPLPRTKNGKKSIIEYCKELGIGVYFIDIDTKQISHELLPQKTKKVWEIQRAQVMDYLAEEH